MSWCHRRSIYLLSGVIIAASVAASLLAVPFETAIAATIVVTTVSDDLTPNDGSVSLREAITAINVGTNLGDPDIIAEGPGTFGSSDAINFNIPGSGVRTIQVGASASAASIALPSVTKTVNISGYSQTGTSANTLANGDNATLLVELDGSSAGANADGLRLGPLTGGSTIRGLVINRFSRNGIDVQSNGNSIVGNFIGVNPLGDAAEPNQVDGIRIESTFDNTIGGVSPAARNIVSGNNADGIHLLLTAASPPAGTVIEGNFIGVNAAGTGPVGFRASDGSFAGNGLFGIEIATGTDNTVGGTAAGARNVIGFNLDGIELDDGAQGNVVQGNFVGVGADGLAIVGQERHGIAVRSDDNLAAPFGPGIANEPATAGNFIGSNPTTLAAGAGNVIEFNGAAGVAVFGNPLPNNSSPAQNSGNSILGNSIFGNGLSNPGAFVGIDLTAAFVYPKDGGVTANDSVGHGSANNPNNAQNFPVLMSETFPAGHTQVAGTFAQSVSPSTGFRIEFFSSTSCSATLFGEGQTFLGSTNILTDLSGNASFIVMLPTVPITDFITATATNVTADPSSPAGSVSLYNTSEFSRCYADLIFRDGFQ